MADLGDEIDGNRAGGIELDLSIVVVSYNTVDLLRACLASLPAACTPLVWDAWVVDNASHDGSQEMVAAEFPAVHLIANAENAGFTKANNQALRRASGQVLLILNPDTEPEPGSLALMVSALRADNTIGAVGPMLLNTDGSLQRNGRRFPTVWREFLGHAGLAALSRRAFDRRLEYGREDFAVPADVDEVSGACLMLRRDVTDRVGFMSEEFFMFYEETEWCWRIRKAGFRVQYLPAARVKHHWMASVKRDSRRMTQVLYRSARTYWRKTGGLPAQCAIECVILIGSARNSLLHLGVWVKRQLRRARMIR
ncbi:MAG: glycosyltransferase family 2 protein [Armatimonadetes bacterium]|nr:glycosyltransferase family 2 protein [Armatimonadota bacterium]MDE2207756.1 glycosyltransferase family 2 protein [Armatimonadota bacterium]